MDELQLQQYKSAVEAILFVSDKPIVLDQLKDVLPELKPAELQQVIRGLQEEYVQRNAGMMVMEIAGGWQMLSNSHAASYIREFYKTRTKEKLSKPALETLAIIAYKQPIGRADVEVVRGVNSDGVVAHLLNKGLIRIVGRKEVPGRPFLYGTTKEFLEYFGLKSLEDLPKIDLAALKIDPSAIAEPAAEEVSPVADAAVPAPEPTTQLEQAIDAMQEAAASQESSGQSRVAQESAVAPGQENT